jgi:ribosomal protein S7
MPNRIERGRTLRHRAAVLAVGALAAMGVAACGTATKDISVGGKTYHISSSDDLHSTNGLAWLMNQTNVDQAGAKCVADQLAQNGVTTVEQTGESKNGPKNDAARAACANQ